MLSLDENHFEKSIFTLTRYDKSLLKYYLHLKEKINYDSKNFIPKSVSLGSAAVGARRWGGRWAREDDQV